MQDEESTATGKKRGLNAGVKMGNDKGAMKREWKRQKGEVNLEALPGFIGEKENYMSETERSKIKFWR
jgi:hypothetical protein